MCPVGLNIWEVLLADGHNQPDGYKKGKYLSLFNFYLNIAIHLLKTYSYRFADSSFVLRNRLCGQNKIILLILVINLNKDNSKVGKGNVVKHNLQSLLS